MQTFILLFQSKDQKGIVAKLSEFIFLHQGNIITANQHTTNPIHGHFFMRIEFCIDNQRFDLNYLCAKFGPVARKFNAKWVINAKSEILRMGVLVSKPDHCLVDLLYLYASGELNVKIPFVISNHEIHQEVVERYGIPFYYIPATKNKTREAEILSVVSKQSDFLVLARYMLKLSNNFLKHYKNDIINIHHSFLPSFKGANPYRQAFEKGVKVIGATAHFVNDHLDEGPIISQVVEPVSHKDGVKDLIRKGKNLEKIALSKAISDYVDYRIIQYKNRTIVF